MKKILMMAALAVASLSANAQTWVGGSLGFDYEDISNQDSKTYFSFAPTVGYNLSEDWAIALQLSVAFGSDGVSELHTSGLKTQDIVFAPFARYTFARVGAASFFLDGGFGFGSHKLDDADAQNQWHIGIRPGVSFNIGGNFSLVGTAGYLGYRHMDDYNHFGLKADNELGSVGLFYTF